MREIFKKAKAKVIGAATLVKKKAACAVTFAKKKVTGAATFAKEKVCGFVVGVRRTSRVLAVRTRLMLATNRAENFVDSGVKILIAVVIGALLLSGLYALFGDTILPTLTERVEDMFDFKG